MKQRLADFEIPNLVSVKEGEVFYTKFNFLKNIKKIEKLIFVFDFDGVVISNEEEIVYKLNEIEGERNFLNHAAKKIGLNAEIYDTNYLRHLIYQYSLDKLQSPCAPGPISHLAEELSAERFPFFILSARSSVSAVRRAMSYMEERGIKPQENFFVGRVAKGRQLNLIAKESSGWNVVYIDDSARHYRNSIALSRTEIFTIRLKWLNNLDRKIARENYKAVISRALDKEKALD